MPHIQVVPNVPGIASLFATFPKTGKPMRAVAEALLRGPSPLTPEERELIASFVSNGNECKFCTATHSAAAAHAGKGDYAVVDAVKLDFTTAPISPKLKALLAIADKVRVDGRTVTTADVAKARNAGATDEDIHDAVLVAAAFCMFNRYVDGLATWAPSDAKVYDEMGKRLATNGYLVPSVGPGAPAGGGPLATLHSPETGRRT